MITQTFRIVCNAPSAWTDLSLPATFHTQGDSIVCNGSQTVEETSLFHAARTFTKSGWHVADNGRTYCPLHAENARKLDREARAKAREHDDGA